MHTQTHIRAWSKEMSIECTCLKSWPLTFILPSFHLLPTIVPIVCSLMQNVVHLNLGKVGRGYISVKPIRYALISSLWNSSKQLIRVLITTHTIILIALAISSANMESLSFLFFLPPHPIFLIFRLLEAKHFFQELDIVSLNRQHYTSGPVSYTHLTLPTKA